MTKPKRKNPQDATLRNITALKKRVAALEALTSGVVGFLENEFKVRRLKFLK